MDHPWAGGGELEGDKTGTRDLITSIYTSKNSGSHTMPFSLPTCCAGCNDRFILWVTNEQGTLQFQVWQTNVMKGKLCLWPKRSLEKCCKSSEDGENGSERIWVGFLEEGYLGWAWIGSEARGEGRLHGEGVKRGQPGDREGQQCSKHTDFGTGERVWVQCWVM